MEKVFKKVTEYYTDPKEDEPEEVTDALDKGTKSEIRADETKPEFNICSIKAKEAVKQLFDKFVDQQIKVLKKGHESQAVDLLLGNPTISDGEGKTKKIKGTLAYAGVSLNNRLYLPEQLSKGDGMTVPLILNHASVSGAEAELPQLPENFRIGLINGEEMKIGQISMTWKADENTLYYEGEISDEFFIGEVDSGKMTVSLGMYYDADSPTICDRECYTVIKGAEFHEVSLVYHPGFPIATIEAVESLLKLKAFESISVFAKAEEYGRKVIQEVLGGGETINDSDLFFQMLGKGFEKQVATEVVKKLANEENATRDEIREWMIANENEDPTIRFGITKVRADKILANEVEDSQIFEMLNDIADEWQDDGHLYNNQEWDTEVADRLGVKVEEVTRFRESQGWDSADEAVGPHSRDYSYVINEPTSTPESTGSNATQYSKPPSTRTYNSRVNQNLEPDSLNADEELSVSGPASSDTMHANKEDEEPLVLPEGKVVTPIRGKKS